MIYIMKNRKRLMVIISMLISVSVMVMIFLFSTQNVTTSDGLSMKAARVLANVIKKITALFPSSQTSNPVSTQGNFLKDLDHYIRKAAHVLEYALLGGTLTWHLKEGCEYREKRILWWNRLLVILIGSLYAGSDEFHQLFVEGRGAQIKDVAIDTIGVILGTLLAFAVINIRRKKKRIE